MFTWNELSALGLIRILKDPELVIYFMKTLKPLRRELVEKESREWHQSLRINQEDRWKSIAELSQKRKYHGMNASVPITCTLPFDGGMWRNSRLLLRSIRYFRRSFIKCPGCLDGQDELAEPFPVPPDEMEIPQKIKTVNLMLGDTKKSKDFRGGWGVLDIQEALEDFILFEEDSSEEEYSDDQDEDKPYILVETLEKPEWAWSDGGLTMNIIG